MSYSLFCYSYIFIFGATDYIFRLDYRYKLRDLRTQKKRESWLFS